VRINGRPLLHDAAANQLNTALTALTLTTFDVVAYRTTPEGGGAAKAQYSAVDADSRVHAGEIDFRLNPDGKIASITFRE
jgi:hypothetical protein